MMGSSDKGLFEELEVQERTAGAGSVGEVRIREARRDQLELQVVDLDGLVSRDHRVRAVWAFVESLDLSPLYDQVRARAHVAGRPAIDVKILLTLWLYATIEGLGSARRLAALCGRDHVYRWICGGVGVNHHTLSDFRVNHGAFLDRLLSESVTAMVSEGLVSLESLAQDGLKVRAGAGSGSFRGEKGLALLLGEAEARVAALKKEIDDDPGASTRRQRAARERAARERAQRVEAAQKRLQELKAERERRSKTDKTKVSQQKPVRASTSDADARVMKMSDGGFRPAYNFQIACDLKSLIIVGLGIDTTGSDRGCTIPMMQQIGRRYGRLPQEHLLDGGFTNNEATNWAHERSIKLYCAATANKHKTEPYAPRKSDTPGVRAWRLRMASEQGQETYRRRPIAECVNADLRNRGLQQLTVRGVTKAKTILLWYALAHNLLRMISMRKAAMA